MVFFIQAFFFPEENKVRWEEGRTVTKDDFKSKVNLSDNGFKSRGSISINFTYKIKQIADDSLILDIYSFFTPEESYMDKLFFDYDDFFAESCLRALNHEQRHFDIAEIYSRKFKASIPNEISENYSNVLDSLYIMQYDSFCLTTKKYDIETEHGSNDSMQVVWNKTIDSILNKYSGYKNNRWAVAWGIE